MIAIGQVGIKHLKGLCAAVALYRSSFDTGLPTSNNFGELSRLEDVRVGLEVVILIPCITS